MNLEEMVLRVHPGDGVIARFEGAAVAIMASNVNQDPMVDQILDLVETCADGAPSPGRSLSRRLAGLITEAEPDQVPSFAALAQAEGGLAILLHGAVDATIVGVDGEEHLSGRQVATWVDRIIETPIESVVVGPAGSVAEAAGGRTDLRGGVVHGGGLSLVGDLAPARAPVAKAKSHARSFAAPPKAAPGPLTDTNGTSSGEETEERTSVGRMTFGTEPPPVAEFQSMLLTASEPEEARDPLPVAGAAPDAAEESPGTVIKGVVCSRGHFDDPSAQFCLVCGISMVHRTLNLVDGIRPPLGVLVFDDGSTYTLDGDYVMGREPGRDETVMSGDARPLTVVDHEREISRVHAGVALDGWHVTVVDRGSANGTFISNPDETTWSQLTPHLPVVVKGGTRLRLGQRTVLFDSPHSR